MTRLLELDHNPHQSRLVVIRVVLLMLALSGLILDGCGKADGDDVRFGRFRPRHEQVLFYNNFEEPESLDPGLLTGHPDAFVAQQIFEGLTELDPVNLDPRPAVAKSWEHSADGKHWVFHLRKDAKWSDGTKVTSNDFRNAWERVLRPSTAAHYAYQLYPIKNAKLYNSGRVASVAVPGARPRRPPFVRLGTGLAPEPPSLQQFAQGAVVELIDSNLRRTPAKKEVALLREPSTDAEVASVLRPGQDAIVLASRLPSGVAAQPGKRVKGAWVQIRPPGKAAGWTLEDNVRRSFPSVNLRRAEGERALGDSLALRDHPGTSAAVNVLADDDDLLEILQRGEQFSRVLHLDSGQAGYARNDHLDNVVGDRHWFFVRVQQKHQPPESESETEGTRGHSATSGWVPARYLISDADTLGVTALDAQTLEVDLEQPLPYFLSLTAFSSYRPVPLATVEKYGARWTRPEHIVSNGPFELVTHRPRDLIELVRSQTYYDAAKVGLTRAVIYAVTDAHTNLNLYRAGFIDAMASTRIPIEVLSSVQNRPDYLEGGSFSTSYLKLNINAGPLKDRRVRQALNLAIDKKLLTQRLLKGGRRPATHVVPPIAKRYPGVEGEPFSPEKARRLLAQAGFPGGKGFPTLRYLFNHSDEQRLLAEFLQDQWKEHLGIDITLQNQEWKTYLSQLRGQDYDIARSGWIGDYLDPNTFLDVWVSGGGNNETGYANSEYDALITQAAQTLDDTKRMELFAQCEGILNQDMPVVPLFYYRNNLLLAPEVQGYGPNLIDTHPLKYVRLRPSALTSTAAPSGPHSSAMPAKAAH